MAGLFDLVGARGNAAGVKAHPHPEQGKTSASCPRGASRARTPGVEVDDPTALEHVKGRSRLLREPPSLRGRSLESLLDPEKVSID